MISRVLIPWLLSGLVLAGAFGFDLWRKGKIENLEAEITRLEHELRGATARSENIKKDRESDAFIDSMSDRELDDLGAEWMRRDPGGSPRD